VGAARTLPRTRGSAHCLALQWYGLARCCNFEVFKHERPRFLREGLLAGDGVFVLDTLLNLARQSDAALWLRSTEGARGRMLSRGQHWRAFEARLQ
jgi:hypothetical protein